MKKKIVVTGTNGSFEGWIRVAFNHNREVKAVRNPSTHEEEDKVVWYHRVLGTVPFEEGVIKSEEFRDERDVFKHIEKVEAKIRYKLHVKANSGEDSEIVKKLKELGFE